MLKNYFIALMMVFGSCMCLHAQVTSEPTPLQETSQDVKIYFHADQGNKSLMGLPPSIKVYAHTGCDLSNGKVWQSAPTWGDNSDKYLLTYVSENLYELYIGDMREYYNITDPTVTITQLDFVFRTADTKTQTNDLFLPVVDSGLQISLESTVPGDLITLADSYVTFKIGATMEADISLSVNGSQIASQSNTNVLTASYLFENPGDYSVVATATADGETVSITKNYFYANDSQEAQYPGGTPIMGPVKNADGSVTFCLGAPQKESVVLIGAWNDYAYTNAQVMNYQVVDEMKYFWTTIEGLQDDVMYGYYFLIDGDKTVGDPYARLVLDPYNDKYLNTDVFPGLPEYPQNKVTTTPVAIYQGNINDYDWQVENFVGVEPENLIIYELLFRDFTGTEGQSRGNGTVRQAIEKIPYLVDLGVNCIEVLPIMEFSGNNSWGYNPNFYFAVDKAYGTPDDYKEFIDICHQNGIAVVLDMVFNQSDGLHPWYQMYQPGSNPFYNLDAPHAYSVLNDWNQGMPMVQQQWDDVLRYWMTEYKFDGFRFDLVKGLGNNDSYANNGDAATNAYNESRVQRMIRLHSVMNEINPNAYFINENLAGTKEENEMAEDGQLNWVNVNNGACQFAMGYSSDSNMNSLYAPKYNRTWGSTVSYLESHDEQRLAYKQDQWGVDGVKGNTETSMQRCGSAAAQMIMTPGAHMIWKFSEMGNAQNTKNDNGGNNTDPKKVNWALLDEPNHKGLYDNYSELINIRNLNKDMFTEDVSFTMNCGSTNWANGRTLISRNDDTEIITVVNPNITGNLTVEIDFLNKDNSAYRILSKSYNSNPSFDANAGTVTVPANCYVVIGSDTVTGAVKEVENSDDTFRVYSANGMIVVDYAPNGVEIFSLDGAKVASIKESGKVNVASGLYILRSGSKTLKVMVN